VVVEETTNNIQLLRRQAMATLFNKTLIVFSLVTILLLIFATRLSYRLRKLSKQVDASIDEYGRYVTSFNPSKATDEIGDLSRNYTSMLKRLKQYHDYLEGMAARLSHELRTPIAVVQSSLEHLQSAATDGPSGSYAQRAGEGVARLNLIVSRLSEAVRLEQSLQTAKKQPVDCRQLLNDCVAGYRLAFPHQEIKLILPDGPCIRNVAPDLIVQMMDKLINNAVDFSSPGTPIEIKLAVSENTWMIYVINYGATLPEQMSGQIFNSMVSVRNKKDGKQPHLGLGLYMVKLIAEFHGGQAQAGNMINEPGVEFIIKLTG
jgi:signal transduction histidine kinase